MLHMISFIFGIVLYFLPSFVGWSTKNRGGIFIVNLLFGWTVLGWIGALIWAAISEEDTRYYGN